VALEEHPSRYLVSHWVVWAQNLQTKKRRMKKTETQPNLDPLSLCSGPASTALEDYPSQYLVSHEIVQA